MRSDSNEQIQLEPVDHAALRTNQAVIIGLLLSGFLADAPEIPALTGLAMLIASGLGKPAFVSVYRALARVRLLKPDILRDNQAPHRFAQGLGGSFLLIGTLMHWVGLSLMGWGLTWLVIALAALNLFGGFCVGCAFYYWFHRLGLPGFSKSPPPGTPPGRAPRRRGT